MQGFCKFGKNTSKTREFLSLSLSLSLLLVKLNSFVLNPKFTIKMLLFAFLLGFANLCFADDVELLKKEMDAKLKVEKDPLKRFEIIKEYNDKLDDDIEKHFAERDCLVDFKADACKFFIIINEKRGTIQSPQQCDIKSCNDIGVIYELAGYLQKAVEYYERSINLGDNKSLLNLAILYQNNQNFQNAAINYEKACISLNDKDERAFKADACTYDRGKLQDGRTHKAR